MKFVKGTEKLAFWSVVAQDATTYKRLQGFDEFSKSMNPNEYSRKYVDEEFERTDVTRYSPSFSFGFNPIVGNAVHDDLIKMSDNEVIGSDAVRSVVVVDLSQETETKGTYKAVKRDFSVIFDSEDNSDELLKYTGNCKTAGEPVFGTATTTDGWMTAVFEADSE